MHLLRLAVEHLRDQVVGDRALAPGELRGERLGVGVAGERQRRQPQTGRPPLGSPVQQCRGRLRQVQTGCLQQRARLVEREAEIGGADLGQLGFQAQPVQAQPEVVAAGDHESKLGRRAHQEQLELAQRLWRAQLVQVVDHEPDTVLERRQVLQQPLDDPSAVEGRRRRESPHGGRGAAERVDHRDPEPLRVALLVPDRHPRHRVREPRVADPRPDEQCLAAPRGRRDRNDPACPLEPLEQRAAENDPVRHGSGLGGACGEGAFHTTVSQLRRATATPRRRGATYQPSSRVTLVKVG